jgi:hypothetical protein
MTELIARSIVLSLAWFTGVNAIASAFAALAAIAVRKMDTIGRPRLLLSIRLFPSVVSLLFAGALFAPSHWALEPRDTKETFGVVVLGLAGAGVLLIGRSMGRGISLAIVSQRWRFSLGRQPANLPGVHEVDDLPGISLAGIINPQILIGPRVLAELSPPELDMAIAHELAHRDALDNISRWCMICAPDLLSGSAIARQLEEDWRAAAESRADAKATGGDTGRACHLASALIKVARLSAGWTGRLPAPSWSRLNDCALLELRVRRLVDGLEPLAEAGANRFRLAAIALGGLLVAAPLLAEPIHRATEAIVAFLP